MDALVNTVLIILGLDLLLALGLYIGYRRHPHSIRNTIGRALRDDRIFR